MKPEREAAEGEDVPKVVIRSGRGVYKLDGNEYEGDWVDDMMQGAGNFKFMGGSVYNVSGQLRSCLHLPPAPFCVPFSFPSSLTPSLLSCHSQVLCLYPSLLQQHM